MGKSPPFLLFSLSLSFVVLRELDRARCLPVEDREPLLKSCPMVGCIPLPASAGGTLARGSIPLYGGHRVMNHHIGKRTDIILNYYSPVGMVTPYWRTGDMRIAKGRNYKMSGCRVLHVSSIESLPSA